MNGSMDRNEKQWADRLVADLNNADDSDNDEGWVDDDETYEVRGDC